MSDIAERKSTRAPTQAFNPKRGAVRRDSTFKLVVSNDLTAVPQQRSWASKQVEGLKDIIIQPINILLVFVPLGICSAKMEWGPLSTFSCNFMAIVPLAAVLGASTEALAAHTGQMIGGLLNATFGNAVEMLVTVSAIRANLVAVVQQSLIGSILSNLLLVMGMAFIASGMVQTTSVFNSTGAGTSMSCLVLASLALTLPTVFAHMPEAETHDSAHLSRIISVILAFVYCAFLVFQLRTHAELFTGGEEDDHEPEKLLSVGTSVSVLFATTCAVACCSEILVDSIQGLSETYGLPQSFIGLILLPIVGNAAEHATAVTAARKGMMDLALGIAVGSSTQIALFVVPCAVMFGWAWEQPMNLNFTVFETTCQMLTVFLVSQVLAHGETNWLHGAMLMTVYAFIAVQTLFIPNGVH
mmetsp:Transcript_29629/g.84498  ORF Transcript_29629/g.84498 Transcript_29629/m.84498 type:complete len:413 (-) Transcript_29629:107-1345(-)